MAFPDKLLNEGEHVVVSTRTHPEALLLHASEQGRVDLHDIPRVEQVQLKVAEELHRLAGRHGRTDDGA